MHCAMGTHAPFSLPHLPRPHSSPSLAVTSLVKYLQRERASGRHLHAHHAPVEPPTPSTAVGNWGMLRDKVMTDVRHAKPSVTDSVEEFATLYEEVSWLSEVVNAVFLLINSLLFQETKNPFRTLGSQRDKTALRRRRTLANLAKAIGREDTEAEALAEEMEQRALEGQSEADEEQQEKVFRRPRRRPRPRRITTQAVPAGLRRLTLTNPVPRRPPDTDGESVAAETEDSGSLRSTTPATPARTVSGHLWPTIEADSSGGNPTKHQPSHSTSLKEMPVSPTHVMPQHSLSLRDAPHGHLPEPHKGILKPSSSPTSISHSGSLRAHAPSTATTAPPQSPSHTGSLTAPASPTTVGAAQVPPSHSGSFTVPSLPRAVPDDAVGVDDDAAMSSPSIRPGLPPTARVIDLSGEGNVHESVV